MIEVGAAIEDDFGDVGGLAAFGNDLADRGGGFRGAAVLDRRLDVLVERRGSGERAAARIVDNLGVDVLVRAENAQARTSEGALLERATDPGLAAFRTFEADGHP